MPKSNEELEREIIDLKSRLRDVERFLSCFPVVDHYLRPPEISDEELFEDAKRLVPELKEVNAPALQRWLQISFGKSMRLQERLEKEGIIKK